MRSGAEILRAMPVLFSFIAMGCNAKHEANDSPPSVGTRRPATVRTAPRLPEHFAVGRAATDVEVARWNRDVNASGTGLPPGSGTHAQGARIYAQKCALCHGQRGEGLGSGATAYPRLIGREPRAGFPFGRDLAYVKTIGNYWPYATTVYDYLQRAMPLNAPGSLQPQEVYSLTAFLLAENEIIAKSTAMDSRSLPSVRMPARDRFVRDTRENVSPIR